MRQGHFSSPFLGFCGIVTAICSGCSHPAYGSDTSSIVTFYGSSDASAAVALNDHCFVVADDENNILRIYDRNRPGLPVSTFDLTDYLKPDIDGPEADIEGATRVENRIYWITSHGRNKDGKMRPSRYRFFALDMVMQSDRMTFLPVGTPCTTLIQQLVADPRARSLGLDSATRLDNQLSKKEREILAPKELGLNIEALAASPDGKTLYIGFRNPRPKDPLAAQPNRPMALVIPLANPDEILLHGRAPRFGIPLLWDMNGLGLRSMEYSPLHKAFWILAGHHDSKSTFQLYRWSGNPVLPPKPEPNLKIPKDFSPEALFFSGDAESWILSDDGTLPIPVRYPSECTEDLVNDCCENKFLADPSKKSFRALRYLLVP